MSEDTIFFLNFGIHSVVLGALGWLLVRFVVRDALRRCILANLAVLFCLIGPFNIFLRDVSPVKEAMPVWTPLRETFEADWRVSVSPAMVGPQMVATPQTRGWNVDVDNVVGVLRWVVWAGVVLLLGRLAVQSLRVQRWAWRLRPLKRAEREKLPAEMDTGRLGVFDRPGTPCVAGWFFPVIAVPASAFQELNHTQWRWLMRHESEHLRGHDTVAVLIQHIVRALLWWNPFVHALIEEYARGREEACDAAALGGEKAHTPYAEFLLSWAARPAQQPACVMSMAQSLPARRLKARLTALMEARGVRKKVGALFVLLCLAFAMIAPLLAASFGIATTASAQEATAPKVDDGKMYSRVYVVAPDFLATGVPAPEPGASGLNPRRTEIELLKEKGVPFPEGASAYYAPATSQLIVRNTAPNLALVERAIDAVHLRPVMIHFACKLIQADQFLGAHDSILSAEEAQALVREVAQRKNVDLMSAPSVTTKLNQHATVEVVREVLPKPGADGKPSGDLKLLGPSIALIAKPPVKDRCAVNVKVDLGVDAGSDATWLPEKERPVDWDNVQLFTVASQKELASGETLLLQLPTAKRPVTVLITATALRPDGTHAASFAETTLAAPPAREGKDMPEEKGDPMGAWTRAYRIPSSFGGGQQPLEYLKAQGIPFPTGTAAQMRDGQLIVRNTKKNLDLVEALMEHLLAADRPTKQIHLAVKVVDVKRDADGLLDLLFPDTKREPGTAAPLLSPRQFTMQGILTAPQFQVVFVNLAKGRHKVAPLPSAAVKSGHEAVFDIPQQKGRQIKATPVLGPDGNTIELNLQVTSADPPQAITTSVTIWDGQTVILAGQATEQDGVQRVIFVTAQMFEPAGKPDGK
ncbi:MAG: M56 family metallopeptidase [Prosthecobacter sp.]